MNSRSFILSMTLAITIQFADSSICAQSQPVLTDRCNETSFALEKAEQIRVNARVAEAAEMLMTEFYKNLWQKRLSRIEALRRGQIPVLDREIRA